MKKVDIVIIGCGPVGATAANLLSAQGHSVVIFDAATDFHGEPRAIHMDHETMRISRGIGIDKEFRDFYTPFNGMEFLDEEHNRKFLLKAADARSGEQGYMFGQAELELSLRRKMKSYDNLDLKLGNIVIDLKQKDEEVQVYYKSVGSHEICEVSAKYVIGSDGAASFTRKHLNISSEDLGFDETWLVADCELSEPVELLKYGQQVCDISRPSTFIPAENNHRRWEFMLLPGETPDNINNDGSIYQLVAPWGVTPANLKIKRTAVHTFHAVVCHQWRKNSVF